MAAGREEDLSPGGVAISRLVVPAEGEPIGGLVMVPGLGDHAGRYERVFGEFARRGITTVASDFPGHGESSGQRGHIEGRGEVYGVIDSSSRRLRELVPGLPLGVAAHSMGALWLMDYFVAGGGAEFGCVWLSSALVDPGHGQPRWRRWLGRSAEKVFPRLTISSGVGTSDCYETDAPGRDRQAERESGTHARVSLRLAVELLRAAGRVAEGARELFDGTALLMTHGGDDRVCRPGLAAELFEKFAARDKEFVTVPGALHEPWHDPEMVARVAGWVASHLLDEGRGATG